MHFSSPQSSVEEARDTFFKAENENKNWKLKLDLYVKASKKYLKAAGAIVGDKYAVDALLFLSSASLYKAELANTMILAASTCTSVEIPSESSEELIGEASLSGRALLLPTSRDKKRGGEGAGSSRMRISGVMSIPKASNMAPSSAANDLFFLEKKLGELGLMSSSSYKNNDVTSTLTSSLGESFMFLSSSSYPTRASKVPSRVPSIPSPLSTTQPVRKTLPASTKNKELINQSNRRPVSNKERTVITNKPIESGTEKVIQITGPYGGIKNRVNGPMGNNPRPPTNTAGKGPNTFWLPNPLDILAWRGIGSVHNPDPNPSPASRTAKENSDQIESEFGKECDLQWNDDRSVYGGPINSQELYQSDSNNSQISASNLTRCFVSSSTANNNPNPNRNPDPSSNTNSNPLSSSNFLSNSQTNSNSNNSNLCPNPNLISNSNVKSDTNPNSNPNNSNLNNSFTNINSSNSMSESVLRLLQSMKRLGDENSSLLQRIDLLSTVENRNVFLQKEMTNFRKEYQDRFIRLKEVLREFQRNHVKDDNTNLSYTDLNLYGFEFSPIPGSGKGSVIHAASSYNKSNTFDPNSNVKSNPDSTETQPNDNDNKIEEKKFNMEPSKDNGNDQQKDDSLRQQQLERTVLALVRRLEQNKSDLEQRDKLIGKYEKYWKHLKKESEKKDVERKEGERRGLGNEREPNLNRINERISSANSVSSNVSISGNTSGINGGNNSGNSSSNANRQHQQQRGQSLMPVRNKHPSISTLESILKRHL